MKEVSNDKTQRVKGTQQRTPSTCSVKKNRDKTDESNMFKEHIFKEIFKSLSGPVGNPESSTAVCRRSPKSKFQIPGLDTVDSSLVSY